MASEGAHQNFEEGRSSISNSSESNSIMDFEKAPALAKRKWWATPFSRMQRVKKSGLKKCNRICFGFCLAFSVILLVQIFPNF